MSLHAVPPPLLRVPRLRPPPPPLRLRPPRPSRRRRPLRRRLLLRPTAPPLRRWQPRPRAAAVREARAPPRPNEPRQAPVLRRGPRTCPECLARALPPRTPRPPRPRAKRKPKPEPYDGVVLDRVPLLLGPLRVREEVRG